ncbi:MAG: polysaccharide deacetylase family protein [Proteobacteria bacterium]|nr:polysaccharide deacetylase family protein [Pseudomonadota bacterium]
MRLIWKLSFVISAALGAGLQIPADARAEDTCPKGTLGVSRTIEVDTTGGPWIGEPHGDPKFLEPGEVALTFDDGPSPQDTRKILAALAKECTKATFFMVGEMVALHPEIVKEVAEQGHTIGTHTWTHPNVARLTLPEIKQEVESTIDIVQKNSPQPVAPFFRYPYLSSSKLSEDYFKSRNIAQFAVDIDSNDWRVRSPAPVIARVMAGLKARGRGIILMHDIHKWTADAVPQLLAKLKAGGYKVVQLKVKTPLQVIADVLPPAPKPVTKRSSRRVKRKAYTKYSSHARRAALRRKSALVE